MIGPWKNHLVHIDDVRLQQQPNALSVAWGVQGILSHYSQHHKNYKAHKSGQGAGHWPTVRRDTRPIHLTPFTPRGDTIQSHCVSHWPTGRRDTGRIHLTPYTTRGDIINTINTIQSHCVSHWPAEGIPGLYIEHHTQHMAHDPSQGVKHMGHDSMQDVKHRGHDSMQDVKNRGHGSRQGVSHRRHDPRQGVKHIAHGSRQGASHRGHGSRQGVSHLPVSAATTSAVWPGAGTRCAKVLGQFILLQYV